MSEMREVGKSSVLADLVSLTKTRVISLLLVTTITPMFARETFIGVSDSAPTLRVVIDHYLKHTGLDIKPAHEVDSLVMAMSLVASTRGVALLPAYPRNFLLGQ